MPYEDSREGVHHVLFSVSSTRFSLPNSQCSSSIQRSPPKRSRTDRVQHIQGGRSASPHSSLRRVSILPRSSCPVVISSLFFFKSLLLSFLYPMASPESQCAQSQRSGACQPRLTAITHFHSMLNSTNRHAPETCAFARTHTVVSLREAVREAVFMVGGPPLLWPLFGVYPVAAKKNKVERKEEKKASSQPPAAAALADPPWLKCSGDEPSGAVYCGQSDLICHYSVGSFLFILLFMAASKWTLRRLAGSLLKGWEQIFCFFSPANISQISIQM